MPYPLPLTRTEAYLAYKAGVIQQSDLKPSLAVPLNGIDAWLAYWTGLTDAYPVKNAGKNLFDDSTLYHGYYELTPPYKLVADEKYRTAIINNLPAGTYTFSCDLENCYLLRYVADGSTNSISDGSSHYTFTTNSSDKLMICFRKSDSSTITQTVKCQLEKGSTATDYEPYTGGPLILQEEEAYIAYLCGVINEYPEKCLRRVGAYLRYLISARWGRPDHPLNREELYLSLIKTQFIPSGDPSSDIVIDGTAKAAFVDVKMYGDTFQQTYTGKNLANTYGMSITAGGTGITLTKDSDGTIVLNGTSTDTYNNIRIDATDILTPHIGQNITVSVSVSGTGGFGNFGVKSINENLIVCTLQKLTTTRTLESRGSYVIDLFFSSGFTFSNYKLKLQVEAGTTATDYEPYVGGTPAPNPDYPQPIQTVTGLQTVEVSGKNLLSSVWEPGSYSTITGGKQDVANTYRTAEKVAVQSDTTYIVSRDSAGLAMNYYEYDANGNFLSYTLKSANQSITTGQTTKFITMSRSQTGGFEKMMLESGSTITAYEPYSSNEYEINLGKNLFDKDNVVQGIPQASDGSIGQVTSIGRTCQFIPVMPNTVYSHTGHPLGWAVVAWYKADKSFIRRDANITTITSPSEAAYASVSCALGNLGTCQFEAGEPTDYAPYFTPIELCKIGTYQDYIWKDGESWKVHKATVSAIIDGSESWNTSGTNTFYVANIYSKIGNSIQSASTGEMYASHFTIADITSSNTLVGASLKVDDAHNVSNLRIRLQDMSGGVAGFRQMLSAKKPSIYARRLTPTDTTITDQTLIAQLEALVNGGAENGTTYIKVNAVSPNLPGLLYVEAPKYE